MPFSMVDGGNGFVTTAYRPLTSLRELRAHVGGEFGFVCLGRAAELLI
jgi:hypothetical protein